MRKAITVFLTAIFITVFLPGDAHARTCVALTSPTFGIGFTASIAAGAVTTNATQVSTANHIIVEIDLTDADNSVTNIRATWLVGDTSLTAARAVPECSVVAPVLTCEPRALDWDPTVGGKNWVLPLSFAYEFTELTFTPTGHGAGDVIEIHLRRCTD